MCLPCAYGVCFFCVWCVCPVCSLSLTHQDVNTDSDVGADSQRCVLGVIGRMLTFIERKDLRAIQDMKRQVCVWERVYIYMYHRVYQRICVRFGVVGVGIYVSFF